MSGSIAREFVEPSPSAFSHSVRTRSIPADSGKLGLISIDSERFSTSSPQIG